MMHQPILNNNVKYYYDSSFDTINIYLGRASDFYSEEEIRGVYFIRNEVNEELIGIEILNYSKINKEKISLLLPQDLKGIFECINIAQ